MSSHDQEEHPEGAEKGGQTVLLSDVPAEADAFGGHARVAQALANLIEADNGGRTIGLEGGWGAGKSTVVRLLSARLSDDTAVFTFDAWAHEDDPLRRSFLEALIDFVNVRGWLSDEEKWQREADRLARRRRETEQHSDQHLTSNGRWITGSLLFVPVGSAVLNWALGQSKVNPFEAALGALITLAPLLVVGWLLLRSRGKGDPSDDASNGDEHRDHPLSILGESSTVHQKSLTVEDHDPTSVEFEKVFGRLLSDVLEDESRRLVLVLDNLDRVGAETSGRVLATLQTFINLGGRLPVSKRVWVLLPYDREGFKKLWGDATDQQLDKICQARFYVPPVLTADWRAYFKDRIVHAMPARPNSQIDEAVGIAIAAQVDGLWPTGAIQGVSPSPRDMVLLANDVAALELQRPNVELKHLTYYAILRRQRVIDDVGSSLASGQIPTARIASILGNDGADNLAALHFNVSVEQSKQVLLAEPASLALRRGNAEALKELAAYPGFWDVLQTLPYGEWTAGGANDIALAGSALEQADLLGQMPAAVAGSFAAAMRSQDESWGPLTSDAGRGLASLARLTTIDVDPGSILSRFELLGSEEGQGGREGRVRALAGFVEVLGVAEANAHPVPVEAGAEDFVDLCAVVARIDESRAVRQLLQPSASPKDVASVVASWAGEAPKQTRSLETLDVLLAGSALRGAHTQVADAFVAYLQGAPGDASPQSLFAVQVLFRLQSHAPGSSRPIADDGTLLDVFYALQAADESARAAEAAVLYLLVLPDVPEPPAKGNSAAGAAVLREVLEGQGPELVRDAFQRLAVANEADVAYSIAVAAAEVKPAVADAIRVVLQETGASADRLINYWDTISGLVAADELVPLAKGNSAELADRIESSTKLPNQLERLVLEIALEQTDHEWAASVVSSLRTRLESMSQDEWAAALGAGGHEMDLLNLFVLGGVRPALAAEFQEALIGFGKSLVEGETPPLDARYEKLPEVLSADHHRRAVAGKVAGLAIGAGQDLPPAVLRVFGPLLRNSPELLEHEQFVSGLVADSVRARNASAISWCAEVLAEKPELLERRPEDAANITDLVRAAIGDDPPPPDLASLAAAIGVEVPEATESGES